MRAIKNNAFKIRKFKLLLLAVLLAAIGLFFIYDLTPGKYADMFHYVEIQASGIMLGMVVAIVIYKIDYHSWKYFGILYGPFMLLNCIAMADQMELLPETIKRAGAYLGVGNIRVNLYETAFLYVCLILPFITSKENEIKEIAVFVLFANMVVLLCANFDYIGVIMIMVAAMMIIMVGDIRGKFPMFLRIGLLVAICIMIFVAVRETAYNYMLYKYPINEIRFVSGLEVAFEKSRDDIAYGGIFGRGVGTFANAPEIYGDAIITHTMFELYDGVLGAYIMSGIIREVGWLGAGFILLTYLIFLFEMVKIAVQSEDKRGIALVSGIAIRFMAMFIGSLFASITYSSAFSLRLPFISYGFDGIVIDFFCVGLVLSVSRRNKVK